MAPSNSSGLVITRCAPHIAEGCNIRPRLRLHVLEQRLLGELCSEANGEFLETLTPLQPDLTLRQKVRRYSESRVPLVVGN